MCQAFTTPNVLTHNARAMENGKYHSTVKQASLKNIKPECAIHYLASLLEDVSSLHTHNAHCTVDSSTQVVLITQQAFPSGL